MLWITISNLLMTAVTLGLFFPWAKVRDMRYRAAHTALITDGSIHQSIAAEQGSQNALGSEMGSILGLDLGL